MSKKDVCNFQGGYGGGFGFGYRSSYFKELLAEIVSWHLVPSATAQACCAAKKKTTSSHTGPNDFAWFPLGSLWPFSDRDMGCPASWRCGVPCQRGSCLLATPDRSGFLTCSAEQHRDCFRRGCRVSASSLQLADSEAVGIPPQTDTTARESGKNNKFSNRKFSIISHSHV